MTQLTFSDVEYLGKRKRTRREVFLSEMDQDYAIDRILGSGPGGLDLDFTTDSVNDITQVVAGTAGNNLAYDPLGRLTDVKTLNNALVSKYGYDKTGNRQSKQTASGTQGYTYPTTSHRLGAVAGVGRGHDSAGNTTTIGNRSFVYGDHGRLLTVKDGATVLKQYAYNGKGERVRKYAGATPEHLFTYDDAGQLLGQYVPTGAAASPRVREYVWMDDLPVAMFDAAAGTAHYIEPDHLGTPRAVIDPSRNVAVWSWPLVNDAFGESAANQNPDGDAIAFEQPLRFPGQFLDNETGLHYNYFRDYESSTGRYAQSDPIGLQGGLSTYGYVGGSPFRKSDPLGLAAYICKRGNGLGMTVPVHFITQNGADEEDVQRIIKAAEAGWNTTVGDLNVSMQIKRVDANYRGIMNTVRVFEGDGRSYDTGVMTIPTWPGTYAHEAGHWLGINTERYWSSQPRLQNSVMGYGGPVLPADIDEILRSRDNVMVEGCDCEK